MKVSMRGRSLQPNESHNAQVSISNVNLFYGQFHALRDISFRIEQGEQVVLTGRSGSGKTSLLLLLAGVLRASSGTANVLGVEYSKASVDEISRLRRENMGFVFQNSELLPELSVAENIAFPCMLLGKGRTSVTETVNELAESLGITHILSRSIYELSGGELQRAAVARALSHSPRILLADEPTGSLDSKNANFVIDALMRLSVERNTTLVIVTHDQEISKKMNRNLHLEDGRVC